MNILVLGAGTFGTAISNELSYNLNNNVILFSRNQAKVDEINLLNTNKSYFPNKKLNKEISATSEKSKIKYADIVFIALPSSVIIDVLDDLTPYFNKNTLLVNLSKGLFECGSTIIDSIKEKTNINNVVSLKGPSFAVELIEHSDTLLTLGYTTKSQLELMENITTDTSIYLDKTKDIRGVELLSVIKNIYALFVGVIDARYNSPNTRFMILTKAFSEIRIMLRLLKGSEDTLFLACGFGDFCLTSLNDLSRNRTLGLLIGKGFYNGKYESNEVVLEGLKAIKLLYEIDVIKLNNDLPIFNKIHSFFENNQKNFDLNFSKL